MLPDWMSAHYIYNMHWKIEKITFGKENNKKKSGMVVPGIPEPRRWGQNDSKFRSSLFSQTA